LPTTPPTVENGELVVQTDIDYNDITLYVPIGAKSAYAQAPGWSKFTNIVEMKPGDVNGDGKVNVGDIMAVINFMAGQTAGINKDIADVNGDGNVNVGDIMAIINIMATSITP
jgi:hypothetical protein